MINEHNPEEINLPLLITVRSAPDEPLSDGGLCLLEGPAVVVWWYTASAGAPQSGRMFGEQIFAGTLCAAKTEEAERQKKKKT